MHTSLEILAVCLLTILCAIHKIYTYITSPEKSIPGPWLARFSRLWYYLHVRSGNFHHENIALHAKFGNVVRVGPNLYSITDPDKNVYGIGSKFRKSDWYEGWKHPSPDRWTLFPDQDMKRHAETRKKFQNLYSMSSLVSYEKYVDRCIDIFQGKMASFGKSGESIDMALWFQCYAFDVLGDITYSERFGFLEQGEDISGMLAALDSSMVYSTLVGIYAWAHPYLYAIMENIPGSGAAGRNFLMQFVQQKITERNQARSEAKMAEKNELRELNDDAPRDFLDKLTDAHERDPQRVTPYHIFMMGLSNIVAGSDTTAVSLSSILYNLITHPSTLAKLRQEIKEHQTQRDSSSNFITFKEAHAMPYLQAVTKEALRMHPATGLPLWRVVPQGGAFIAGHQFPAGATVGINSWVAHYNPEVFGPDADVFRPERWLEAEQEKGEQYQRMEANYMPVCIAFLDLVLYISSICSPLQFGLGSRTCLGRHVSMLEMCKLVPRLVTDFDFELDMATTPWKTINYWFVKPVDFRVRVKPRS
jgi:cytochrome P450